MSNRVNLEKLIAKRDALSSMIKDAALKQVHALMDEHGLTTADLNGAHPARTPRTVEAVTKAKPKSAKPSKAKVKVTGRRRGPQPPKYRNPETGETWSGVARAPAWIRDVADRDEYLIK
jgi:DNA-binding protein H-NS